MDFKKELFDLIQIAEKQLQTRQRQLDNSDNLSKSHIQGQINNVIDRIDNYKETLKIAVNSNETIPNFKDEIRKIEEQIKEINI
jgi:ribosome assembly protein YihI (activator of Der GTPase)